MITTKSYEATGNELADRILRLIPEHPGVLEMESASQLFTIDGFECDDLQPSLAQAEWALSMAQFTYRKQQKERATT